MTDMMEGVKKLTELAGSNSMQLLMFYLGKGRERFGINVFKVQEVCRCPELSLLPHADPASCGVATIRGKTLPVFDLAAAIGLPPLTEKRHAPLIVSEYNSQVIGYLVYELDRIVHTPWSQVSSPPAMIGQRSYLTAVTRVDDAFVEIIDVEQVLSEIMPTLMSEEVGVSSDPRAGAGDEHLVLVVDDSSVARRQIQRPLETLGVEVAMANDGRQGLNLLREWQVSDPERLGRLAMIISDIEMPEMDGYTLTHEVKQDPGLSRIPVILHSSVTGDFNRNMVEKVGADRFLAKYDPNDLFEAVIHYLNKGGEEASAA